jgi:hypothetical protein
MDGTSQATFASFSRVWMGSCWIGVRRHHQPLQPPVTSDGRRLQEETKGERTQGASPYQPIARKAQQTRAGCPIE